MKTGVTSASFQSFRNTHLVNVSLKSCAEHFTELEFSIYGGILLCVAAFLGFRILIGSNLKLFPVVILYLIRQILGWDSNFTVAIQ